MCLSVWCSKRVDADLLFQGLDDMPKSPRKHRRVPSKKSSDSVGEPSKGDSGKSSPVRKIEFEDVEGSKNGSKLVSVKPDEVNVKHARSDRKPQTNGYKNGELVSGRKAGQRWETSRIRFAPMNVPLQRRLQTLVVLFHTLCVALLISGFFFLCAIPLFWPIIIPYMIYCMTSRASTDGKLSHRSEYVRSLSIWSLFSSYFPARLHRTQELPPTRKYVFGYHPHGIISHGAFAAFGTESLGFKQLFPGITNTLLTLDSNFRIPLYRDYALALGIGSVSKESCENILSQGGPNKACPSPLSYLLHSH